MEYFYENEGFTSTNPKSAYKNMLNRGLIQSPYLVIEDCGLDDKYMTRRIENRVIVEQQDIQEIWVRRGDKLDLLYKNAIAP